MSAKYPVISVTGSSGTRRGVVRDAFERMMGRVGSTMAYVDGASFHRYTRKEMMEKQDWCRRNDAPYFSHFGPEANLFEDLEALFESYGKNGIGRARRYLHTEEEAEEAGREPGSFTDWSDLGGSDMLLYEGLHGNVRHNDLWVGQHVDLRIGVAPIINLEWIQKFNKDINTRGYEPEEVRDTILGRMNDYVRYIVPQFANTDVNFQRVPVVDTSDPINNHAEPSDHECLVVIRFRRPYEWDVDFPLLLDQIRGSRMSRRNSIVIPGSEYEFALEMVLEPLLKQLLERKKSAAA